MISPHELNEALAWLSDLPNRPDLDPDSEAAVAWVGRLMAELQEVRATGPALIAACRAISRRAGQFYPTPGQIAEEVRTRLLEAVKAQRETEWQQHKQLIHDPDLRNEGPGWSHGRFLTADYRDVQDLVRRGHAGRESGEGYMAAVLREERERADAEAAGREYVPRRYGPSLEASTNPMKKYLR